MKQMRFLFDPARCTACAACVMACFDQNDIDPAQGQPPFRRVQTVERDGRLTFLSIACMHCADAPCIAACPTGGLRRDAESGLVICEDSICVGCGRCVSACPLGAVSLYRKRAQKCDGCLERQRHGLLPACVRVCPSGALNCVPAEEITEEAPTAAQLSEKFLVK